MPIDDVKVMKVKITCKHCGYANEVSYSDFRSAMIGNHFFKLGCEKCTKRTFVTYSKFSLPYEYGEIPEKIFGRIAIPEEAQNPQPIIVEEKETKNEIN